MATAITIHVTAEDIEDGTKSNCVDCPIARALRRAFPEWNVEVYTDQARLIKYAAPGTDEKIQVKEICLTQKAARFIEQFDKGFPVQPTTLRFTYIRDHEYVSMHDGS